MKSSIKIIFSMFVAFMFFALNMESGYAQTTKELPSAPTEGILSDDLVSGYGEIQFNTDNSIQALDYLISGTCTIRATDNRLTITGSTRAAIAVDTIAVTLWLQRWDSTNSKWVDVAYLGETKVGKQKRVEAGKQVTVAKGYYYRTRAHHYVNHKGTIEQLQSFSGYIYLD